MNDTVVGILLAGIVIIGIVVFMFSSDTSVTDTKNQAAETSVTNQVVDDAAGLDSSVDTQMMVGGEIMQPTSDIVSNVASASNLTTAAAAIKAAGLTETLQGPGPFTVFVPSNSAFERLPAGMVDMLIDNNNNEQLTNVLTYHVVMGEYTAADFTDNQELITVQGEVITVGKSTAGSLSINGSAQIETADVISSNGVFFVIDSVLMPEEVN